MIKQDQLTEGEIIMIKGRMQVYTSILFVLFSVVLFGCSGEEGGGVTTSRSIQVTPSAFDFGIVTEGNSPAPLEVIITNKGSERLNVSNISLSDTDNFVLDVTGGTTPCGTASPALAVGASCTSEVAFQPTPTGVFLATLGITSDDPDTPTFQLPLSGTREEESSINVTINQVARDCPAGTTITAYVSVTDQGGYPVNGLTIADFKIAEAGGYTGDPDNISFVEQVSEPISVALVMDNSSSMQRAGAIGPMTGAAVEFVNQINVYDEVEIIKFDEDIVVEQTFTSDKELLITAIEKLWDGSGTALYDAVYRAITDIDAQATERKSVLVITDGQDQGVSKTPLNVLIDYANSLDIPVFIIGLGDNIDVVYLQQITDETGGEYYEANTAQNMTTIHQQLADVLFKDQYILTYASSLGAGATADLTIQAIWEKDTKQILLCP